MDMPSSAPVGDLMAVGYEFLPQPLFENETGVVGANRNLHRET